LARSYYDNRAFNLPRRATWCLGKLEPRIKFVLASFIEKEKPGPAKLLHEASYEGITPMAVNRFCGYRSQRHWKCVDPPPPQSPRPVNSCANDFTCAMLWPATQLTPPRKWPTIYDEGSNNNLKSWNLGLSSNCTPIHTQSNPTVDKAKLNRNRQKYNSPIRWAHFEPPLKAGSGGVFTSINHSMSAVWLMPSPIRGQGNLINPKSPGCFPMWKPFKLDPNTHQEIRFAQPEFSTPRARPGTVYCRAFFHEKKSGIPVEPPAPCPRCTPNRYGIYAKRVFWDAIMHQTPHVRVFLPMDEKPAANTGVNWTQFLFDE